MTPGQCHLRSVSQQTCPWEDFLQSVCSKTVQPPDGTVVLLLFPCTLSFPEKVCVFMIVWIDPCLPVHPAGKPSVEVMRGPSWETGWRKRCREREGGGVEKTIPNWHCIAGEERRELMNVCREYARDCILHLKLPTTEFFIHFVTRALKLIWRDGSPKNKNSVMIYSPSCSFKPVWLTSVENQGEV